MSLRTRILLLVLLATLAPAVALGLFLLDNREHDVDEAKRSLGALAQYAAENLDDKVKGTVQLLHGLSRAPDIDTLDKAACSEFLAVVLGRYPQYTGLLTITPNGDLHCDSLRSGRKLNVSARDYFKQTRASLEPAFDVVFGGLTGIAVLQVAYPLLDGQGTLKYVLLASLNLTQYAQSFAAASQHPSIKVLIWNRTGSLMASKPDAGGANVVGKNFAASELFRFAVAGNAGTATDLPDLDGVPRVWAHGVIPDPQGGGARMTLGIPRDVLVAEANRSLRNALAVLLTVSLLAFIGAWYVAETGIRRHVRRIASVAGRVGAGDLGARIGAPYPGGELGELMAVVDRTSGAVQAQQAELESRSHDLQRANRTHRMLSGVNSLVVRIRDSQELLEEACRIAVEQGNFGIAWIGSFDPATLDVTPIAWAGLGAEGYLSNIKSTVRGDLPEGQGAVGRAIRELRPVFNNDISAETGVGSVRRAEALRRGYRSVIVLPLFVDGTVKAIFSMFAKELNYFDDEEVGLLTELAGNISFALDHMARQKKIEKLSRIRSVLGNINAAIVRIHDKQQLLEEACHIAAEQGRLGAVWIGSLDPATLDITPVAWAGEDSEAIRTTKSTARDAPPRGQGPVSRAARERRAVFNNDLFLQSFGNPRRDAVLKLGFRSMIALPLLEGDKVVGTFTLYAREPGFFDPDEIALLTEMAGNVSFALEHMAHQQRIEKLSRIRAVSSEVNAAIVRSRTRQILFYEACRIAIEHGRFGIAWIGEIDSEKQEVLPVATAGLEDSDFIMHTVLSIRADSALGAGVLPRAVRDRRPVFSNDITVDADIGGERRKEAIRRGYRSVIVLPLMVDGAVEATFAMFAKERNYFDDEEVGLLTELAGNISLALEHMARQEKIEKLSRIRAISSEINVAIVRIHERHALLKEACRIASEHGKFEMVWIGSIDHEKQEVRPVAWAGFSPETAHSVSWASVNAATGTVGEALRARKPAVRNDIESQVSAGGKLRGEALERGCRSSVCLPLVVGDKVTTFIVLFATGRGFFNKDELALLDEVASNISFALQAIERQEKFDYLSYYDPLTGLPNRTLFMDRVGQQLRVRAGEPRMVALILLNIERFRYINESLGRHGGDALLNLVAQRLEAAFHGKDFLARISADSFGVVIRGIQDAKAALHAVQNQAFGCFRDPYRVNDSELRVAAKAGIAMFPADGADADTLFKNAEAALKKARDSSERYLFYAADMNERAAHNLSMETRLRKAVEAQQFVLHYQPKIELANDKICGLEALIRWQDPESGLVAPGTFIPLLEETGLILDVGKWALGQALADHREWTARGCAVPRIAVNVSAVQLQQKDFADMVAGVVQQHGDHPDALELEVTESLLMKDVQESIRKLSILRERGINIAMDDFGTGYSSLSYIARLPINSVKIDRSFINGMAGNPQDMSIVSTIITLAHSLNLRVVAEGVETAEQSKLLLLLKCEEAQGFLFSKPLPAAEIELLLRAPA